MSTANMPLPARTPLSGRQYTIGAGGYEATVASVGATLRELSFSGRPLILGFGADEIRPGHRGALLAPWPNRVIGGRYTFDGVSHLLALTEPDKGHAIHGLVQWLDWEIMDSDAEAVSLRTVVQATEGYPFRLEVSVRYRVSPQGLHTELTARNTGKTAAPYGASVHPYFVAPGNPDSWRVTLAADRVLTADEALAPKDLVDVAGTEFDLRDGPELHGRFIDNAYTAIAVEDDDLHIAQLIGDGGAGAEIEFRTSMPWAQVYTGALEHPDGPSVAIEPMTCPPNAFQTGQDLIRIEPGESVTHEWTIRALP